MESAGTAERAADLVSADGLAYVMHHDERGARSLAQSQQALAERRHRARVVFILVVRGIERVQNDDLGGRGTRRREKMLKTLRRAEKVTSGAGIDEEVLIGNIAHSAAHRSQSAHELRDG